MNKILLKYTIILFSAGFILVACQKKKEDPKPDDTNQQITTAADQADVESETNNTHNDADLVVSGSSGNARVASTFSYSNSLIVNATVDSMGGGSYLITYHGKCADSSKNRTGTIAIQVDLNSGSHWANAGTAISLTYTNYKVTNQSTGKSITFNGSTIITNVNGGNWNQLLNGTVTTLTHNIAGTISITFDDGTTRSWTMTKQRVVKRLSSSQYTISITGTGKSPDGINDVAFAGINRFGNNVTARIFNPLIWEYNSYWTPNAVTWIPIGGTINLEGSQGFLILNFGLDTSGFMVVTGAKPTSYKLNWVDLNGNFKSTVITW